MIFPLSGLVIGAILGALRARARGGKRLDMLQWGAAFAILFSIAGIFVMIILQRTLA